MPCATDREHTHALQHVTAKVQSCHAVFSRQSQCTDGLASTALGGDLRAGARHNVERDMSSELRRRSTLRVCRGVSFAAVSISQHFPSFAAATAGGNWSAAPRRSCLIFVLMLSRDQSGHIARISRGFSALLQPLPQSTSRPMMQKFQHVRGLIEKSSSSIIVMTSSRARNAPRRRVHLTTSQQWLE